ncbi:MAG: ATP-binding protein [Burkholderiaceae bacterium]
MTITDIPAALEPASEWPVLLDALVSLRDGGRQARLPAGWRGAAGSVADAFNDVAEQNARMAAELARLRRLVEQQGQPGQRSRLLAELSRALSGALDGVDGMHALLAHVVPALASTAIVALLDDDGVVEFVASRAKVLEDESFALDLAPADLPSAHFGLLRAALAEPASWRAHEGSYSDGALHMLPLAQGSRLLGALWIDGEVTPRGDAMLADVAACAAFAFAGARLDRNLRAESIRRREAEARLAESDQRRDEFVAMLAHELRNPLMPLRNAIEVMRLAAPVESKLDWAVRATDRQLRQLTRLVDELLDVARVSEGKIVLQLQCVDFVALVAQCAEALRPMFEERGQLLTLSMPGQLLNLNGDAARLRQIIDDLLTNAGKYTPDGGSVSIVVSRETTADGEFAVLSVSDDGIGIEPALLPRVFDLFEQGKRALDRAPGGLGVGLTLVKRLVELHGGTIEAASAGAGQGARFKARLPCLSEIDGAVSIDDDFDEPPAPVATIKILVVDDNVDIAESTSMLLTLSGHDVRSAKDGLQALQSAAEFSPDVVLLDIGLPLMDGYEIARRLRRMPQTRAARLIAMTGYGQEGDRQRAKMAGFDGHLLKPVEAQTLADAIAGRNGF